MYSKIIIIIIGTAFTNPLDQAFQPARQVQNAFKNTMKLNSLVNVMKKTANQGNPLPPLPNN